MKKRILYLNGRTVLSPWTEIGRPPPEGVVLEGCALEKANEWSATIDSDPVRIVLLDIDVIAQTQALDEWVVKAWRATFNDLVARALGPDGSSPLLLAYTREPTWERATLALRLGARDITKLSKLTERVNELLQKPGAKPESESPNETESPEDAEASAKVIPWRKPEANPPGMGKEGSLIEPGLAPIPRHAIPFPIEGLEGSSHAIESVRALIRKTAPLDVSILIQGPTGSGKERVARAIHRYSQRGAGPFVAINCGAIAPGLIESELFGHTKGAFTGANDDRVGLIASANGGTLFLDEVSELPLEFQVKLLRTLQDRQVTPVGASKPLAVDLRILAASKVDLEERVAQGKFREDLLYRLRVMEIALPALRERKADIPSLAKTILKKLAKRARRPVLNLDEESVEKFLLHAWPGNIRELENTLEHAATLAWADQRPTICLRDLPEGVQFATMSVNKEQHLKEIVKNFEREYILATVRRLGSKEHAAESLGLSLATLYRKIGT